VSVTDDEMRVWTPLVGADTGIFCAPEGAATAAAVAVLRARGDLRGDEEVVLFNTGSGLKYVRARSSGRTTSMGGRRRPAKAARSMASNSAREAIVVPMTCVCFQNIALRFTSTFAPVVAP
jgi:threonine synthase